MLLKTHVKFEPGLVKRQYVDLNDFLLPGIMKAKKKTVEREYSKTTTNHQKLITKRIGKAPYLAQHFKIGKVIKRFRTKAFTYIDQ